MQYVSTKNRELLLAKLAVFPKATDLCSLWTDELQCRPGACFSKVPKLFGWISGDIILFVSSKQRCLEARNFAVLLIFIPFTTYENTSFTEKVSQSFMNGFSSPKSLRDFRETGPSSDNGSVSCDKQWSPKRDDCQARDNLTWHAVSLFGQQREGRLMFQCNKITLEVSSKYCLFINRDHVTSVWILAEVACSHVT